MENKIIFLILLILLIYLVFTQKGQGLIKKFIGGSSINSSGNTNKVQPLEPMKPGDYPSRTQPGQAIG
jgi:hypothetical protein